MSETNQLKEKLDEFVDQKVNDHIKSLKEEMKNSTDAKEPQEIKNTHTHATRSFDKFCTDCGSENPDYKKSDFFCSECNSPLGSENDVLNSKVCYNCGSSNAIDKSNMDNDD